MLGYAMIVGLIVLGADDQNGGGVSTSADRVTLRDGSVVLGLVTASSPGSRGSTELLVRRAWAQKAIGQHLQRWDRATTASSRQAVVQRRKRLESWRRERARGSEPGDRIIGWLDRELARLAAPGEPKPSVLLNVRLPHNEVQAMDRKPASVERLLRLAWLCEFPDPETMPLAQLKDALQSRGYDIDGAAAKTPVSVESLLPPTPEPEANWQARRAATELTVDSGLRFIRFQDTIMPDAGGGQDMSAVGLSSALSEIKKLLDPDGGRQADPLEEKLGAIAARGRVGAVVTRLEIQPDMSAVTVEATLWVRGPGERWAPFGFRRATVRPDDLAGAAGQNLAEDPQVKGAFRIVEMLGLGAIPADVKDRSLRIGAATEKALGTARSAFNQDLDAMALPVTEPGRGDQGNPR
jgi:hypothetical protein